MVAYSYLKMAGVGFLIWEIKRVARFSDPYVSTYLLDYRYLATLLSLAFWLYRYPNNILAYQHEIQKIIYTA